MRSRIANMKVKGKVFNEHILPVMTYRSETWVLNNAMEEILSVNQCKMECIMLGITLRDRKRNTWICQHTGIEDIISTIRRNKHRWAGYMARLTDNRWMIRATEWAPRQCRRS